VTENVELETSLQVNYLWEVDYERQMEEVGHGGVGA
jgi:hypothetical protein